MSMSKEAQDFRKRINRDISKEKAEAYADAKNRESAHEEFIGKTGMATRISSYELEKLEQEAEGFEIDD